MVVSACPVCSSDRESPCLAISPRVAEQSNSMVSLLPFLPFFLEFTTSLDQNGFCKRPLSLFRTQRTRVVPQSPVTTIIRLANPHLI